MPDRPTHEEQSGRGEHRGSAMRVLGRILLGLVVVVLILFVGAILLLQNDSVATRIVNALAARVGPWPGGTIHVARVSLDGLSGIDVSGLHIANAVDEPMVTADSIAFEFRPLALVRRRLIVPNAYVAGLEVTMRQRTDSTWDLLAPFTTPDTAGRESGGPGFAIRLGRAEIARTRIVATFSPDSVLRVEDVAVLVRNVTWPEPPAFTVDTLHARIHPPGRPDQPAQFSARLSLEGGTLRVPGLRLASDSSDVRAEGTLGWPNGENAEVRDIDFVLAAVPLDLNDIDGLVPGPALHGDIELEATVRGGPDELAIDADGRTPDGGTLDVHGVLTPRTDGPVRYELEARVRDLDASRWLAASPVGLVNLDANVALKGPSRHAVDGRVTAHVEAVLPGERELLPVDLAADFAAGRATFRLTGGLAPLVALDATGSIEPFAEPGTYDVVITARQLGPLAGGRVADGRLRLSLTGAGIAADGTGRARGSFSAAEGPIVVRHGRFAADWADREAAGRLSAELANGQLTGRFRTDWSGDEVRFDVPELRAAGIDLAAFSDSLRGSANLVMRADARAPRADALSATVALAVPSAGWSALEVDTAWADVRLVRGQLRATAEARANAGSFALRARGRPFAETPVWTIERVALEAVDLAAVRTGLPATHLNATLQGELTGRTGPELDARARLAFDSSTVAGAAIRDGSFLLRVDDGDLSLIGQADALEGRVELALRGRPFDAPATFAVEPLAFRDIALGPLTGERLATSLTGALHADAALPAGQLPRVNALLTVEQAEIQAGRLDSARVALTLAAGVADVDAMLRTAEGSAAIEGRAALERTDTAIVLANMTVSGDVRLPDLPELLGHDTVDGGLEARFRVATADEPSESRAWVANVVAAATWQDARLDTLALDGRLAGGVLTLDTLRVLSNVVHGGGAGRIALLDTDAASPADTLRLHLVSDTSVEALSGLIAIRPLALRGASLEVLATAASTAQAGDSGVRIDGLLALGGAIAGTAGVDTAHARFAVRLDERKLTGATGTLEARGVGVSGNVVERIDLEAAYDGDEVAFETEVRRDLGHSMSLAGRALVREKQLAFDALGFALPGQQWALRDTARIAWGERISVQNAELVWDNRTIMIDGSIDRAGTQAMQIRLDSVPIGGFAEFAGAPSIQGLLDGELQLTGPAAQPILNGDLSADLEGLRALIRLETQDRRLAINADLTNPSGGALRAEGTVPFTLNLAETAPLTPPPPGPLALTLTANAFSLAWLDPFVEPFGVDRFGGQLDGTVELAGTTADLDMTGTVTLTNARVRMPERGVDYERIRGRFTLDGDAVTIADLRVEADGNAQAQGRIVLDPASNPSFDVNFRLNDFRALNADWARIGVSGGLTLAGTLEVPRAIGDLRLVDTDIYLDALSQTPAANPVELTPEDYAMLEQYFGYRPSREAEQRDLIMPMGISVDLALGSDVWVRKRVQPELRMQLSGSLDVRKEPGDSINLFGTVEVLPDRSYMEQFGKRFAIRNGSLTFNGGVMDWIAEFEAAYEVPAFQEASSDITITLSVNGSWEDLELTLGSEPAMETADVLSYLATGRPASSAIAFGQGGNGGVLETGASVAFGAVSQFLEAGAAETIGLDVIDIRQTGLSGVTLVAGRYVSSRLFVGFQQPLALQRQQDGTSDASIGTRVEVEYRAFRWLLLNLQAGQSEFRYFFRSRYSF